MTLKSDFPASVKSTRKSGKASGQNRKSAFRTKCLKNYGTFIYIRLNAQAAKEPEFISMRADLTDCGISSSHRSGEANGIGMSYRTEFLAGIYKQSSGDRRSFLQRIALLCKRCRKKSRGVLWIRGIAADYPFEFFLCIWPWCAQYFWWHYSYSNDVDFLREKAYPLFKDILLFFEDYIKFDKEKDQYLIFPDISPEQGPVTKNATITIACLKFLLKIAIEAGEILNESEEDRRRWAIYCTDCLHTQQANLRNSAKR